MSIKIPTSNEGDKKIRLTLGDNILTIRTYFNTVLDFWIMDLATLEGEDIATGINLVTGINLLEWSQPLTDIYGQFRVIEDAKGVDSLAGIDFFWFAPGEFEELEDPLEVFSPPLSYDFEALFPRVKIG